MNLNVFSSNASKIPHKLNFSHTDYTATSNHDLKNEIVSDLFHFLPPMVLYKLTETNIEEGIVLLKTRILKKRCNPSKAFCRSNCRHIKHRKVTDGRNFEREK